MTLDGPDAKNGLVELFADLDDWERQAEAKRESSGEADIITAPLSGGRRGPTWTNAELYREPAVPEEYRSSSAPRWVTT